MLLLVAIFSLTIASCGKDDKGSPEPGGDDVEDVENGTPQIYGGTWKCVPTLDQKDSEYPYSISFNKNGSLSGKWLEGDGDMSTFSGSWELSGRYLTIIAIFKDENDDYVDSEEWICKILSFTQSELIIDFDGEIFTFIR